MTAPNATYHPNTQTLICEGDWDLAHLSRLKNQLAKMSLPVEGSLVIDGKAISRMDSAGAFLINELQAKSKEESVNIKLLHFDEQHAKLLKLIASKYQQEKEVPESPAPNWLEKIGRATFEQSQEFLLYLSFIGQLSLEALRMGFDPRRWRLKALVSVIYRNGYLALPIIALLSFMIGVVLTYQMGLQLRNYGANIYIVDLLGLAILREFGPLLTAIMVAGRTGSSYTAELGIMKINQEIDALNTMGVTPGELLLLPRIIGLVIALPLLTIWANVFGVLGGMVMSHSMLNITWYDFLQRFPHVIPLKTLLIGLVKTPVFALIIASVGCFLGMRVSGSADSVGKNTTKSVVLSIFFIIVADALFSIYFSKLKL